MEFQLIGKREYHLNPDLESQSGSAESVVKESASYLQKYRDLARELQIAIVPGTILEDLTGNDHLEGDDREIGRAHV